MADTKKEVNRSEMVREYLKTLKPNQRSPKAVCEAMKEKGITVSQQLVSQVKLGFKKKARKNAARIAAKAKHKNSADFQSWTIAKELLRSVGGDLSAAKKNLELVSRLLS
jgi:hypothetical protein